MYILGLGAKISPYPRKGDKVKHGGIHYSGFRIKNQRIIVSLTALWSERRESGKKKKLKPLLHVETFS